MTPAFSFATARNALVAALIMLTFAGGSGSVLAQGAATLEAIVGTERFRAAGLNKLNKPERAELLRWLQSEGIGSGRGSAASAEATDPRGAADDALRDSLLEAQQAREALAAEIAAARAATEQMREKRSAAIAAADAADAKREAAERAAKEVNQDAFESRLVEPFTGWSGKTVFQLENGQRWRQRLPGRYVHMEGDLPRIRITRNFMGYYEMELLGYERKIGVSRMR